MTKFLRKKLRKRKSAIRRPKYRKRIRKTRRKKTFGKKVKRVVFGMAEKKYLINTQNEPRQGFLAKWLNPYIGAIWVPEIDMPNKVIPRGDGTNERIGDTITMTSFKARYSIEWEYTSLPIEKISITQYIPTRRFLN